MGYTYKRASGDSWGDRVQNVNANFVGECGQKLWEYVQMVHKNLARQPKYENIQSFHNWDYGSPNHRGNVWVIRVWLKDSPILRGSNGEEIDGNLEIQIEFGAKVDVTLVMGNTKAILKKSYAANDAQVSTIGLACTEAWEKLLTGSVDYR